MAKSYIQRDQLHPDVQAELDGLKTQLSWTTLMAKSALYAIIAGLVAHFLGWGV